MSCVTCAQPLLEAYPNTGAVQEAVNGKRDDGGLNLNDTLEDIGMGKIRTNADTKEVYAASLDGTDVENWIIDLYAALVNADESHLLEEDWGLMKSKSKFRGLRQGEGRARAVLLVQDVALAQRRKGGWPGCR